MKHYAMCHELTQEAPMLWCTEYITWALLSAHACAIKLMHMPYMCQHGMINLTSNPSIIIAPLHWCPSPRIELIPSSSGPHLEKQTYGSEKLGWSSLPIHLFPILGPTCWVIQIYFLAKHVECLINWMDGLDFASMCNVGICGIYMSFTAHTCATRKAHKTFIERELQKTWQKWWSSMQETFSLNIGWFEEIYKRSNSKYLCSLKALLNSAQVILGVASCPGGRLFRARLDGWIKRVWDDLRRIAASNPTAYGRRPVWAAQG
jgi:hypothetical protein